MYISQNACKEKPSQSGSHKWHSRLTTLIIYHSRVKQESNTFPIALDEGAVAVDIYIDQRLKSTINNERRSELALMDETNPSCNCGL